jgi:hypothetical protein
MFDLPESTLSQMERRITDSITLFLAKFPEYRKVLGLALVHEESNNPWSYQGWRWPDVEIHPTKLMRLVTEGISKISARSRTGTYYLLKDSSIVRKVLRNMQSSPEQVNSV